MVEVEERWYNILEEVLQCPVCLEIPQCFVVLCTIGHHICIFCKNNLRECPLCKQQFIATRNFTVENVVHKLEDMKLCIKKELDNVLQMNEKKIVDASTQTDSVEKAKSCSATQTVEETCTNSMKISKYKQTKHSEIFYSCLIGSCIFKSPYIGLTEHLTEHHKDSFHKIVRFHDVFSEKCIIDTSVLPQHIDFAFLIKGMGLFFFNIVIDYSIKLQTSVQRVQSFKSPVLFHYDLIITHEDRMSKRHGKVKPCGGQKEVGSPYRLYISRPEMLRVMKTPHNKTLECTITIQKCSCSE